MEPMKLETIRVEIDRLDNEIKKLFLERMKMAEHVAIRKNADGSSQIYRADREMDMIDRLTADVPEELVREYAAFIRKTTEVSRMYQYGLLYDWNPSYDKELVEDVEFTDQDQMVTVRLTRQDSCNAMSAILSMIGDYGYNMEQMVLVELDENNQTATFELTIRGCLAEPELRKLLFQLSREALKIKIIRSF